MAAFAPRDRVLAAETLARAEGEEQRDQALTALAAGIGDPRPEVRTTTCHSLAALELPDAWELIVLCLTDTVPEVRQSAAISLGTLGAKAAFEALAEALSEGPADVRFQAATSLVEVDADAAYPLLLDAISSDDDAEVLGAVALSLGAIGNPDSASRIATLLTHDAPQTRFDAAYALAQLADPRACEPLARFLTDDDLGWDAVMALETLGAKSESALGTFLSQPLGTQRARLRAAGALLALGGQNEAAQSCLIDGLRSRKIEHRGLALQELASCAGKWAGPALLALHKSFRGRRMRAEIDEILARIAA